MNPDDNAVNIRLILNGKEQSVRVAPHVTLLELLRETFQLTGAKSGCDDANCGACTVLLDGRPVKSCCLLAAQVDGRQVLTIEGLGEGSFLHPMQQAFLDHFAFQCGFCTPAMILTAKAILDENPQATEAEIRHGLHGNICRCTGYQKIVQAVMAVRDGAVEADTKSKGAAR